MSLIVFTYVFCTCGVTSTRKQKLPAKNNIVAVTPVHIPETHPPHTHTWRHRSTIHSPPTPLSFKPEMSYASRCCSHHRPRVWTASSALLCSSMGVQHMCRAHTHPPISCVVWRYQWCCMRRWKRHTQTQYAYPCSHTHTRTPSLGRPMAGDRAPMS